MLDNDQGLLMHTPPGMGLPNHLLQIKIQNWLPIQCILSYIVGVYKGNCNDILQVMWSCIRIKISFPYFGFPPPKILEPKIWLNFAQRHDMIMNISGTQQDIVSQKTALQTTTLPHRQT